MYELSRKQLRLAAVTYCMVNELPMVGPVIEWVEAETLRHGLARIIG